jgi:hypothetical protein
MTIAGASRTDLFSLFGSIQNEMKTCTSLETAAHSCVGQIYERFSDSIALARLYCTIPYQDLSATNRRFVDQLAESKHISVTAQTPVLSLLGTRGSAADWNDRRNSKGHVGIPLASASFVESIPMVAQLLKEIGFELNWLNAESSAAGVTRSDFSGLFHVPDARTAVDDRQRKVIPAQDFVEQNGVRTVFSVASSYKNNTFFALIVFTREELPKAAAERFMPLVNTFKGATNPLVENGRLFAA